MSTRVVFLVGFSLALSACGNLTSSSVPQVTLATQLDHVHQLFLTKYNGTIPKEELVAKLDELSQTFRKVFSGNLNDHFVSPKSDEILLNFLTDIHGRDKHTYPVSVNSYEELIARFRNTGPDPIRKMPTGTKTQDGFYKLDIPSFREKGTAQEIHNLIAKAEENNSTALIIDLRRSPGGSVNETFAAIAAFLDIQEFNVNLMFCNDLKEKTSVLRTESGDLETHFEINDSSKLAFLYEGLDEKFTKFLSQGLQGNGQDALKIREKFKVIVQQPQFWNSKKKKIVVLTSRYSASGSEYMAHLLRKHVKAYIIGEGTAGAGNTSGLSFPYTIPGSQYGLFLTNSLAYQQDGTPYPERVIPDLIIEDKEDAPYNSAVNYLKNQ